MDDRFEHAAILMAGLLGIAGVIAGLTLFGFAVGWSPLIHSDRQAAPRIAQSFEFDPARPKPSDGPIPERTGP
jgi:hypothetical protein